MKGKEHQWIFEKIAYARVTYLSDRDNSVRITRKKNARTGVLHSNKLPRRAHDRHHGVHRYCVIFKKSVMPEHNYMSHSAEYCTGARTKRPIKYFMVITIGMRNIAVQQYKKSEKRQKKDLKSLKKKNQMLYSITKKSVLGREINKIKNIRAKSSKKTSVSSSDDWDYDSSLARDSIWDKYRQPSGRKDINKLDHAVTENLKNYKDQSNEAINSETTFDNSSFNLSSGTSDPLPVVTVSLWWGKKHRATIVASIKCLWDSGATDSMIKIRHTKNYERKMWSKKVENSTAAGVYWNTHDVKVPFCMPEFSIRNIINHHFHVDNY